MLEGLEIRNSAGRGINLHECYDVTVRRCSIHDVQCRALGGSGEKLLFEGNKVWNARMVNANNAFVRAGKKGGWPAVVQTFMRDDRRPSSDVVFRGNEVRDSCGEGIDAWFLDGGAIEGNTVRDCYGVLIYVDTARNVRIDRNVCTVTSDRYNRADLGGQPHNTYRNILVAHDVVRDVHWDPIGLDKVPDSRPPPSGCAVRNNVFFKGKKGGGVALGNPSAWKFSNNCWPDGVPQAARDPTSFKADPIFPKPESGLPEGFKVAANSPLLGRGAPLMEVSADFWGTPRRKNQTTIGLYEPK